MSTKDEILKGIANLKKGDAVYVDDIYHKGFDGQVVSKGPKYITATAVVNGKLTENNSVKFDYEGRDTSGYSWYYLYPSKELYDRIQEEKRMIDDFERMVSCRKFSADEIRQFLEIHEKNKDE